MNSAEAVIVKYFHPTEDRAEACLMGTPNDLEHANDQDILSVRADASWAVRMIITEVVLLNAFEETKETATLTIEDLINVADCKIQSPDLIEKTMNKLREIRKIPPNHVPKMREIAMSVRTSFNAVRKYLLASLPEKKKRERKMMGSKCLIGRVSEAA